MIINLPKKRNLKINIIATLVIIAYGLAVYFLPINCLFLQITKIECAGCGITRAIISALKLDFKTAFLLNPMFIAIPILYWCLLVEGEPFKNKVLNFILYSLIILGFIITWIFKIT